jgi:hypothetical protein
LVKNPGKRHLARNMVAVLADGLLEIAEIWGILLIPGSGDRASQAIARPLLRRQGA